VGSYSKVVNFERFRLKRKSETRNGKSKKGIEGRA
jgi:hypothetical protein